MATIKIRTRIYLAVEGEGEQSFVRLLQHFADQNDLYVHLDCKVLGGGGYETMFKKAYKHRERIDKVKSSILLIDGDRGERKEDGWTLEQLKKKAKQSDFIVCVQHPNQEGMLLRLLPGYRKIVVTNISDQLVKQWPDYRKPIDFYTLSRRFNLDDLRRVAKIDSDLNSLLSIIGLIKT